MDDIVEKARRFATEAHNASQIKRKYSALPYIVHPQKVVDTLLEYTSDPIILAVAWLHDVIEDTPITESELRNEFDAEIVDIVIELTPPLRSDYPDRKVRKKIENEIIGNASSKAKFIKLADIYNNTDDVRVNDPEFAKIYLPEKLIQLEILKEVHDELWSRVYERVIKELSLLEELA